jgi:hypothetical protein
MVRSMSFKIGAVFIAIVLMSALAIGLPVTSVYADSSDGTTVTAPKTYSIGELIPSNRMAVMDLRVSGDYSNEVREWLPALIQDRLLAAGWTLVQRGQRMAHIQDEQNLPGIKPETRPQANELLGATSLLELTAEVKVNDISAFGLFHWFGGGDLARATIVLNGQIVDPATGVLKASINVKGSDSGLRSIVLGRVGGWNRSGAVGFDINDIRSSLIGKAGDQAALKLVDQLKKVYGPTVNQPGTQAMNVDPSKSTILLNLPPGADAHRGDHYGIYRNDALMAEVEVVRIIGNQAEVRILSQTGALKSTDTARKMPLTINAQ